MVLTEHGKKSFRKEKAKTIIFFFCVAMTPIVGMTIYMTLSLNSSYTSDRLNQIEAVGLSKATALEAWFEERRDDCDLMTEIPTVSEWAEIAGTWGHAQKADAILEIEQMFQFMINIYGTYTEMMLLNTTGYVVAKAIAEGYTFGHDYGEALSSNTYYSYTYAERLDDEYTFLSDIDWDDTVAKDFVAITTSSPIQDESDKFVGIVVFYIDDASLNDLMHNTQGVGISGETYLTDFNGYWLTTSQFHYYTDETDMYDNIGDTIKTEQLTTAGIQEAADTETHVLKSSNNDYRGIAVMGSYNYLMINSESVPWVLVTEIDVMEAVWLANRITTISIWIVVIIAVINVVLGYIFARRNTITRKQ